MVKNNFKRFSLLLAVFFVFIFGLSFGRNLDKKEVLSKSTSGPQHTVSPSPKPAPEANGLYKVVKVVDGDTVDVSIDGKSRAVRLIGVDTPETVDPRKAVQCFGREASDHAKSILTGKNVSLEADPSQGDLDKYRRLLRYVFLEDGTNFNLSEISQGFAHEYTYNLPYKYQAEFKNAEKQASEKEVGLWSPSACGGNTGSGSVPVSEDSPSATPKVTQSSDYKPTGTYACNCSKLCGAIKSCDEAYYQLQNCGCSARDSDGDGLPCESLCN